MIIYQNTFLPKFYFQCAIYRQSLIVLKKQVFKPFYDYTIKFQHTLTIKQIFEVILKFPLRANSLSHIITQLSNILLYKRDYCQDTHLIVQRRKSENSISWKRSRTWPQIIRVRVVLLVPHCWFKFLKMMKEKLNQITRIPYLTNFINSLKNCKQTQSTFYIISNHHVIPSRLSIVFRK